MKPACQVAGPKKSNPFNKSLKNRTGQDVAPEKTPPAAGANRKE